MSRWVKILLTMVLLGATGAGFYWVVAPQPVAVDSALIDRGAIQVTVDEEGKTRIKDIYTVSAPIIGRLLRLPVKVGDAVVAGETPVASILPLSLAFLDQRTRSELGAAAAAPVGRRSGLERSQATSRSTWSRGAPV